MSEVIMPRLSDSMEEGTILTWLKASGDTIARGDSLVEIETDKASMTYEAEASGLLEILAQEGATVPIGQVIAVIRECDSSTTGAGTRRRSAAKSSLANADSRINASPVAVRLARERGIELQTLRGSGPGGRIVKMDVQAAAAEIRGRDEGPAVSDKKARAPGRDAVGPLSPRTAPASSASEEAGVKDEDTLQELSRAQQVIARRMTESKAKIPEFALQAEVEMEACVAFRDSITDLGLDIVPTYNDIVLKACALALRQVPRANASYADGRIELHSRVNVGVAVGADDVLVVPTIFDADSKPLHVIARETRTLSERAREGTIAPSDLAGGTFTVSNLGMYGVERFTPIINPPQVAILAVGSLEQRAVVRDGGIVARRTLGVTLVCDHRVIYGADAAKFLARIRFLLERPFALIL